MVRLGSGLVGFGSLLSAVAFFFLPYLILTRVPTDGLPSSARTYTGWELAAWEALGHGAPNPHPAGLLLWLIPIGALVGIALCFVLVRRPTRGLAAVMTLLGVGAVAPQVYLLIAGVTDGEPVWPFLAVGYWLIWAGALTVVTGGVIATLRNS
jgi:amino acid transporter